MVPELWLGQRQDRWGKKHSLIVGMGNQQTDFLVPDLGESSLGNADRV